MRDIYRFKVHQRPRKKKKNGAGPRGGGRAWAGRRLRRGARGDGVGRVAEGGGGRMAGAEEGGELGGGGWEEANRAALGGAEATAAAEAVATEAAANVAAVTLVRVARA